MAAVAVRGIQRVVVVDVAGGARRGCRRHVRASESEAGDAVIEGCAIPSPGGVAVSAIRYGKRWAGSGVNGRSSLLPLGEMAAGVAAISGRDL